ncbi:MAG: hypothetical protein EXQ86_07315 [Rhodospirillales bacterium]|nr:hypothetical protein [Rhodospirillales bacterium]
MARKARRVRSGLRDRILETALRIAEVEGWSNLRLGRVADALGIPLTAVREEYRDRDDLADEWFRRAELAMLAAAGKSIRAHPPKDRILVLFGAWFEAVTRRRRVTVEMLRTKLYASHPHHWVPMAFNLSRLIQWVRDAAGLEAAGQRRQIEEIGLTSIFVLTLAVWANDATRDRKRTRAFLERALAAADRGTARLFGSARRKVGSARRSG